MQSSFRARGVSLRWHAKRSNSFDRVLVNLYLVKASEGSEVCFRQRLFAAINFFRILLFLNNAMSSRLR